MGWLMRRGSTGPRHQACTLRIGQVACAMWSVHTHIFQRLKQHGGADGFAIWRKSGISRTTSHGTRTWQGWGQAPSTSLFEDDEVPVVVGMTVQRCIPGLLVVPGLEVHSWERRWWKCRRSNLTPCFLLPSSSGVVEQIFKVLSQGRVCQRFVEQIMKLMKVCSENRVQQRFVAQNMTNCWVFSRDTVQQSFMKQYMKLMTVYLLLVEWVTDPFVLVHAYSDLPVAMLAAMLSCVVWWSALVGHCPGRTLPLWWPCPMVAYPWLSDVLCSRVLVAMLDAAAKMVSMICVLCFRVM